MSRVDEEDLQRVKDTADLTQVAEEYTSLRPGGADLLKGLCPLHEERSASFTVRPSQGVWFCHGCHVGGDVIRLVELVENLPFREAVEHLADRFHITLRTTQESPAANGAPGHAGQQRFSRSEQWAVLDAAAQFYAQLLVSSDQAAPGRALLADRDFTAQHAATFRVGWAPTAANGSADTLLKHLLAQGFSTDLVISTGLGTRTSTGTVRDFFRGRVVWPISDVMGRVCGFGARRVLDQDPIEAKYVNSPETSVFKKSRLLFGLNQAKTAAAQTGSLLVVEGYTDVMAAHAAGMPAVVATCGTAFSAEHAHLVRRTMGPGARTVTFAFDDDKAGRKAAQDALAKEPLLGAPAWVVTSTGDGKDPCQVRFDGGDETLKTWMSNTAPLWKVVLERAIAGRDLSSPTGRIGAADAAADLFTPVTDPVLVGEYAREVAARIGVPMPVVLERFTAARNGTAPPRPGGPPETPQEQRPVLSDPQHRLEVEALQLMVAAPTQCTGLFEDTVTATITDPHLAQAHAVLVHTPQDRWGAAVADLEPGPAAVLTWLLTCPTPAPAEFTVADGHAVAAGLHAAATASRIEQTRAVVAGLPPDSAEYREQVVLLFGLQAELRGWQLAAVSTAALT